MERTLLDALNKARQSREPVVVVTDIASGSNRLVTATDFADDPLADEIDARLKSGKSGIVATGRGESFVQVYVPPKRLIVVGAVHITQALAPMATACGFDLTIVDPRTAFATAERFAGYRLLADWPQEVLAEDTFDRFTALVAVTHDPKIDDYPLIKALETDCFYVGALGSRKTHAKRLLRLHEAGLSERQTDRINAPIGFDIGAANPAEIGVAIMAQIIAALRKGG